MASHSLFFRSSTGITSVCTPYCSQDGSPLLILPLVKSFSDNSHPYCLDGSEFLVLQLANCFHKGLYILLSSGWQRIAHSFTHQHLSRQFACHVAQWILAHSCSFARRRLPLLAHCKSCQQLSQRFGRRQARRILHWMAQYFRSSTAIPSAYV